MGFPGGRAEPEDATSRPPPCGRRGRRRASTSTRDGERSGRLDEVRALARGRPVDLAIAPFVFRLHAPGGGRPQPRGGQPALAAADGPSRPGPTRSTLEYGHEGHDPRAAVPAHRRPRDLGPHVPDVREPAARAARPCEDRDLPLSPDRPRVHRARGVPARVRVRLRRARSTPAASRDSLRRTLDLFPAVASRLVAPPRPALRPRALRGRVRLRGRRLARAVRATRRRVRLRRPVETVRAASPSRACAYRRRPTARCSGSACPTPSSTASATSTSSPRGRARSRASRWCRRPTTAGSSSRHPLPTGPSLTARADVQDGCGLFLERATRRHPPRPARAGRRRLFPRTELRALLARAQAGCPVRLSHNDVIAAWLWRDARAGLGRGQAEPPPGSCPVDVRRVLPGFPPTYFGCAVALATAAIERERLREAIPHRPRPPGARRGGRASTRRGWSGVARPSSTACGGRRAPRRSSAATSSTRAPGSWSRTCRGCPSARSCSTRGRPWPSTSSPRPSAAPSSSPPRTGVDVRVCLPQV